MTSDLQLKPGTTCKKCGALLKQEYNLSIRNNVPVYTHENGEMFCKKEGVPEYACAEPKE